MFPFYFHVQLEILKKGKHMQAELTLSTELIKMIPVITGGAITGAIGYFTANLNNNKQLKRERAMLRLAKIEELSKEISDTHSRMVEIVMYKIETNDVKELEDQKFHISTLVNIYCKNVLGIYSKYYQQSIHIYSIVLKGQPEDLTDELKKLQSLYLQLMNSIADNTKKYL